MRLFLFFVIGILFIRCSSADRSTPLLLIPDRVIDGINAEPHQGWEILIEDGLIESIGPDINVPDNVEKLELKGKTVLPGFIDMHGHLYANNGTTVQNEPSYLKLYLAGGVTTIFSPGEFDPYKTLEFKDRIENGEMIGPRIFTAGPYFDHRFKIFRDTNGATNEEKTKALFYDWQDKINGIKVYEHISEMELKFLANKADSLKIPITAHLGNISVQRAVELGVDGLEHGIFTMPEFFKEVEDIGKRVCEIARLDVKSPEVDKLINMIVKNEVYLSPTIITFQSLNPNFEPNTHRWKRT